MTIRARSPLRISFGGGGTDVSPYRDERGGAVLSATVNRYAYATVRPGGDLIEISSVDYDISVAYPLDEPFVFDGQLDLAKVVVDHFRREYGLSGGLQVSLHNDAPPGSGLGSSSAITVALIKALAEHTRLSLDSYELAELAFKLERVDAGIAGGAQDQYAAAFGGFNFIEFDAEATVVSPLRMNPAIVAELEYQMVFAFVGGGHFGSHIIDKQVANYTERRSDAVSAMDEIKEIAHQMRRALLLGDLAQFGSLMNDGWDAKRRMAEGISTPHIDAIYEAARNAGARGGKVSGAGGGGFMFFICEPSARFAVQKAIAEKGAELVSFTFTDRGVESWVVR